MYRIWIAVNSLKPLRMLLATFLIVAIQLPCIAQPLENQLKDSASPYLAAHASDPVAWQEWSPETLELARKENKLLFVSIGYFSCHWCHVMQAESYRNAEIAALINQNFIPVKVDRELDVALDAEMIAYAQNTLGNSGWPLNVFITPEGYPLYAILYEKPVRFKLVLDSLGKEWLKDSDGLKAIAKNAVTTKEKQESKRIKLDASIAKKYRKLLVEDALSQADMLSGGLSVPRKFPLAPQLAALLQIDSQSHDAKLAEWLRLTLDQMASGGLRDHLAGGFFRYTIDPQWQRPHFEKMLYDNAQLVTIYLRAAQIFKQPAYRKIAFETLDFILREMRIDGAFITSISALDDHGKEGGSYLWTEGQLKTILDKDDYQLISKIWGMSSASELEEGYLPLNRIEPSRDEQTRLQQIYTKLGQIRLERNTPKDTKLLSGLNGMVLEALSEAAVLDSGYRKYADKLAEYMLHKLWQNDQLSKGMSNQKLLGQGDLEAYAYSASGLLHYAQLSSKPEQAGIAIQMAKSAWQKFYSANGFLLEQGGELARPYYQAAIEDGPLPSPSSVLIKMSLQSGDKDLRIKAIHALEEGNELINRGPFWMATQVTALSQIYSLKPKR